MVDKGNIVDLSTLRGTGGQGNDDGLDVARVASPVGRGVDLGVIKNRRSHQHTWIMVANFAVDEKVMSKMAEQRDRLAVAIEKAGGEEFEFDEAPVQADMGPNNLLRMDGPGCAKCGIHWLGESGYGAMCPVSDEQYQQAGNPVTTPPPVASE